MAKAAPTVPYATASAWPQHRRAVGVLAVAFDKLSAAQRESFIKKTLDQLAAE